MWLSTVVFSSHAPGVPPQALRLRNPTRFSWQSTMELVLGLAPYSLSVSTKIFSHKEAKVEIGPIPAPNKERFFISRLERGGLSNPFTVSTWRRLPDAWRKPMMVVICPAAQLFADVRTLHIEISALRAQSEQGGVYVVLCS